MKTTFEKKIAKFERKLNTSRNYYERVSRLTEGFWKNHGIKLDEMLTDLKENNSQDWESYCKNKGWFPKLVVSDFFSY